VLVIVSPTHPRIYFTHSLIIMLRITCSLLLVLFLASSNALVIPTNMVERGMLLLEDNLEVRSPMWRALGKELKSQLPGHLLDTGIKLATSKNKPISSGSRAPFLPPRPPQQNSQPVLPKFRPSTVPQQMYIPPRLSQKPASKDPSVLGEVKKAMRQRETEALRTSLPNIPSTLPHHASKVGKAHEVPVKEATPRQQNAPPKVKASAPMTKEQRQKEIEDLKKSVPQVPAQIPFKPSKVGKAHEAPIRGSPRKK